MKTHLWIRLVISATIFLTLPLCVFAQSKKKSPAPKSEGYVIAARYLAADREQFPLPKKNHKKKHKKNKSQSTRN